MTAQSLRSLLAERDGASLLMPGVGTALEARIAASVGFEAIYVSGYGTSAWRHGIPDIGLIGLGEISASLQAVSDVTTVPLMVDADTGYGDVTNVVAAVRQLEARGASAVQLEDQTWPKKCGHMAGKNVVSSGVMERKIRAAVAGRTSSETMIVARTDARGPVSMADALDRAKRYIDAGADAIFVEAPESLAEMEQVVKEVPSILIANMSESGLTPAMTKAQLEELGFDIVLYPSSGVRVAAKALTGFFTDLLAVGDSSAWVPQQSTLTELNAVVGLADYQALEAAAGEA